MLMTRVHISVSQLWQQHMHHSEQDSFYPATQHGDRAKRPVCYEPDCSVHMPCGERQRSTLNRCHLQPLKLWELPFSTHLNHPCKASCSCHRTQTSQ